MKIESFFFNKKDVVLFLVCVILFAVLFILAYDPIQAEGVANGMVGDMKESVYLVLLVVIGFAMLGLSRTYMYFSTKGKRFTFWGYLGWIVVEVVIISFALSILSYNLRPKSDVSYLRLSVRVFFDVVSVLIIPYIVATLLVFLNHQRRQIEYLSELLKVQSSIAAPVVRPSNPLLSFYDRGGRFAFSTNLDCVLYVESADNYCNIHYLNDGKEDYFILHNSMKNVSEQYANQGFVRCHRCFLVNSAKIKATKKTKDGLVVELFDSVKIIPVSKTYADSVMSRND